MYHHLNRVHFMQALQKCFNRKNISTDTTQVSYIMRHLGVMVRKYRKIDHHDGGVFLYYA